MYWIKHDIVYTNKSQANNTYNCNFSLLISTMLKADNTSTSEIVNWSHSITKYFTFDKRNPYISDWWYQGNKRPWDEQISRLWIHHSKLHPSVHPTIRLAGDINDYVLFFCVFCMDCYSVSCSNFITRDVVLYCFVFFINISFSFITLFISVQVLLNKNSFMLFKEKGIYCTYGICVVLLNNFIAYMFLESKCLFVVENSLSINPIRKCLKLTKYCDFSSKIQMKPRRLWSNWMALNLLVGQWKWVTLRSGRPKPRECPCWIQTNWTERALIWVPLDVCSLWRNLPKVGYSVLFICWRL